MLADLIKRLLGRVPIARNCSDEAFATLNREAPIRPIEGEGPGATELKPAEGFVCRETVLGRDQRVAAYYFLLQQGTRNRLVDRSRRIHHVYTEVLVRNLIKMDVARLLGHRLAFFDIPDSFLGHEAMRLLPPQTAVPVLTCLPGAGGPNQAKLLEQIAELRKAGFRFAANANVLGTPQAFLLAAVDFVIVPADSTDPKQLRDFTAMLAAAGAKRQWMAKQLPSYDEFQLCQSLGAQLFQGPFITRREDWSNNSLGPNSARIADLLSRLRRDAEMAEIAGVLKQDPALSLRLMRYINSAAIGLREEITSIERALMQLGREKLYRWLCLLLYGADAGNPAASALLESALVRARMMELLGEARPVSERDALFLVGLLSLVDAVLKVPMEVALAQLATSSEIQAAVARGEGPMGQMLQLVIACESADPTALEVAASRCEIRAETASSAHMEALAWALEVTRE